jgi:hypothetical protein
MYSVHLGCVNTQRGGRLNYMRREIQGGDNMLFFAQKLCKSAARGWCFGGATKLAATTGWRWLRWLGVRRRRIAYLAWIGFSEQATSFT